MVHVKKEYPRAAIQLERLNTELFPTANGFCREGMTALSPEAAAPFLGDLKRLEATDKIGLPLSYANSIYQRAELGAELVLPLIFEIKSLLGRKTHCHPALKDVSVRTCCQVPSTSSSMASRTCTCSCPSGSWKTSRSMSESPCACGAWSWTW